MLPKPSNIISSMTISTRSRTNHIQNLLTMARLLLTTWPDVGAALQRIHLIKDIEVRCITDDSCWSQKSLFIEIKWCALSIKMAAGGSRRMTKNDPLGSGMTTHALCQAFHWRVQSPLLALHGILEMHPPPRETCFACTAQQKQGTDSFSTDSC